MSTDDAPARLDVRAERTRRALQQAALHLARAHPLDDATIAEIAQAAGVNRSSFYQHYADRDTLLADAVEAAEIEVFAGLPMPDGIPATPPADMIDSLRHYEADAELYRRLLGERGSPIVAARIRSRFEQTARAGIIASGTTEFEGMPVEVAAAGIAGSTLGVLRAWLELDPRPGVEVAAEWVWRTLIGPGAPYASR
ncbi:TetR/AcrR family transcriptional regulator [Agromyces seonyuensis]|uniref:TetR family transcriptional regulator n=1 Tax=Agromyces seonyuensis TaxID=2662446 RepID=A0A6I4P3M7_9MICO|nr:TetR/AcrR family transcriptional regulator [Agromyces seonyuensis]MWB99455.1 TetR family transcriptional regulator [Agromyces seonyuensis]